jgi:hypothetical protein
MKWNLKNFHANAVELVVKYIVHAETLEGQSNQRAFQPRGPRIYKVWKFIQATIIQ